MQECDSCLLPFVHSDHPIHAPEVSSSRSSPKLGHQSTYLQWRVMDKDSPVPGHTLQQCYFESNRGSVCLYGNEIANHLPSSLGTGKMLGPPRVRGRMTLVLYLTALTCDPMMRVRESRPHPNDTLPLPRLRWRM